MLHPVQTVCFCFFLNMKTILKAGSCSSPPSHYRIAVVLQQNTLNTVVWYMSQILATAISHPLLWLCNSCTTVFNLLIPIVMYFRRVHCTLFPEVYACSITTCGPTHVMVAEHLHPAVHIHRLPDGALLRTISADELNLKGLCVHAIQYSEQGLLHIAVRREWNFKDLGRMHAIHVYKINERNLRCALHHTACVLYNFMAIILLALLFHVDLVLLSYFIHEMFVLS